jgi:hypothetical protein
MYPTIDIAVRGGTAGRPYRLDKAVSLLTTPLRS